MLDQIVEVHRVACAALGHHSLGERRQRGERAQAVSQRGTPSGPDAIAARDRHGELDRVVVVEDRERSRVPDAPDAFDGQRAAQQHSGHRVKGSDEPALALRRLSSQQRVETNSELARGAVGERQDRDLFERHAVHDMEVRRAVNEHRRLAAADLRMDERRAIAR